MTIPCDHGHDLGHRDFANGHEFAAFLGLKPSPASHGSNALPSGRPSPRKLLILGACARSAIAKARMLVSVCG
jgi:hypothetical protein